MTVANSTMEWSITCDGSTENSTGVPVTSQVYSSAELEVILKTVATGAETPLTLTTDYTITGIPGSSVNVITTSAYSSSYELYVRRVAVLTQTTDLVSGDAIPSSVIETILDKIAMALQVVNNKAARAVLFSLASGITDWTLTDPSVNGGKAIGVNAAGTGLTYITTSTLADASLNDLLSSSGFGTAIYPSTIEVGSTGIKIASGSGSPEGVLIANIGSIYLRTDGSTDTTIYFKESGVSNTGWIARGVFTAVSSDTVTTDTISEKTSANGVVIDSCTVKDGGVSAVTDAGGAGILKPKVFSGTWNMDTDASKTIAHGLTAANIVSIAGTIKNNAADKWFAINASGLVGAGGDNELAFGSNTVPTEAYDGTNFYLRRGAASPFNAAGYNAAVYKVTIWYIT